MGKHCRTSQVHKFSDKLFWQDILTIYFLYIFLASPDAQEVMWVTYWLTDWSLADLTVVTLVSVDTFRWLYWWRWRWISWSWLSCDESYLVMKVMIVKEVITGDVSPVAMFIFLFVFFSTKQLVGVVSGVASRLLPILPHLSKTRHNRLDHKILHQIWAKDIFSSKNLDSLPRLFNVLFRCVRCS